MDGTSWGVEIEYADASVESGGSNEYPTEFRAYPKAVGELLEGREFH